MSMKLSQLRTYWNADDAYLIISFLDELKEMLWDTYGSEIIEQQQEDQNTIDHDDRQWSLELD